MCKHKLCRRTLLAAAFLASMVLIASGHYWACNKEPTVAAELDPYMDLMFKALPWLKPEGWK